MPSPSRAQVNLYRVVAAFLLCAVLLVGAAAFLTVPRPRMLGRQPIASPTLSPEPSPSPSVARLPAADVPGDDLTTLPRYPNSLRSEYEVALDEHYRLTVSEYLATASIDEARAFYQGVIAAHGWERADIGFSDGEWSYTLVDGSTVAFVEIKEVNGLIEIDLQVSEPVAAVAPAAPTEAPHPPAPADDDDDD